MGLFAGVNSFAYVLDSPSNLVDPLGLFCRMSFLDRAKLGGFGVFHVLLGGSKIAGAATATVATDGLAAPLLVYGVPSGVGNLTGGIAEISGAIIGDETLLDSIESISQSATAATTVTGLATLIKTGDLAAAERNSKVEGLFTGGLLGGLRGGMDAYDLGDTAENISDLSKRHTKSMKKCGCE